jgi:RsiW-degrading membrane proteinase PrsW (M82 family)
VLLGTIPTLIGTINNAGFQLTTYLFFFAAVWGVVFRDFIVRSPVKWKWLIASAAFTGLIGTQALRMAYSLLPNLCTRLPESQHVLASLAGSVLTTGVTEELCKALPVVAYLMWKRKQAEPLMAILLGVFSGLGFAAIENIGYADRSIGKPLLLGLRFGEDAYVAGVQSVISNALLRSLSSVFGHAVLSGIVSYFLVMAFLTKRRAPMLAVVGLGLAAILHGCFNWLAPLQRTFATLIDAGIFLLFYGYVSKLRQLIAEGAATLKKPRADDGDTRIESE